jgi:phage repressor protein C with HTH and peptisase S24 domain
MSRRTLGLFIAATMAAAFQPAVAANVKVKEATIKGQKVRVGDEAYKLQDNVRADSFHSSTTYGESSRGTYRDGAATYVVTFGPPRSGGGVYVITQIERSEPAADKKKQR